MACETRQENVFFHHSVFKKRRGGVMILSAVSSREPLAGNRKIEGDSAVTCSNYYQIHTVTALGFHVG